MNVKVKVYYVYTVYFIKSIYILSYIFYKKHAYNRHDVAMLTLLFGQPCKMDQVDANALMVAAIRFPLELRVCQSIVQFFISPRTANVFHHSRNEICLRRCLLYATRGRLYKTLNHFLNHYFVVK
jgi:hypothetical protein